MKEINHTPEPKMPTIKPYSALQLSASKCHARTSKTSSCSIDTNHVSSALWQVTCFALLHIHTELQWNMLHLLPHHSVYPKPCCTVQVQSVDWMLHLRLLLKLYIHIKKHSIRIRYPINNPFGSRLVLCQLPYVMCAVHNMLSTFTTVSSVYCSPFNIHVNCNCIYGQGI